MTVEIKDILLKAAEDVQQGMWCQEAYYIGEATGVWPAFFLGQPNVALLDKVAASKRCAVGSLAYATALLGGETTDWEKAYQAVIQRLHATNRFTGLVGFNDALPPDDPFEAGQQLAELFRTTAEAL